MVEKFRLLIRTNFSLLTYGNNKLNLVYKHRQLTKLSDPSNISEKEY